MNKVCGELLHVGFVNDEPVNVERRLSVDSANRTISKICRETAIRGYSVKTAQAYTYYNRIFLNFIRKSPKNIRVSDIEDFVLFLKMKGYSVNSINLAISALSFYYKKVYRRHFDIKHLKREKSIPTVLSPDEIVRMIGSMKNLKHRLVLELLYSAGLRVGELVKLRVKDILFDEHILIVRAGKGCKDRITLLSRIVAKDLRSYLAFAYPESYVFHGRRGRISVRAVQQIVHNAALKAGITNKRVYPHALRHSFATHLKNRGVSLDVIRRLLGHEHISTTLIYARISSSHLRGIVSPLDCSV